MPSWLSGRPVRTAAFLAVTVLVSLGASGPATAVTAPPEEPPAHVSNAEWLEPLCDVPAERDLDVTTKIYEIATERGVDDKVLLAAFEAGWVESHMNNLPCGHSDSVGVFQQRPSQGWCDEPSQCRDVDHATDAFLDVAVVNDRNHPGYTAGELAQSVQRSAYPDRYDDSEEKAQQLIAEAEQHIRTRALQR